MRVQIQYGIDLDDVPKEVASLMTKAQNALYGTDKAFVKCTSELTKTEGEINFFDVQRCVVESRQALARADMLLRDSFAILAGYQQTKLSQAVEATSGMEQEVPDGEEVQEG